MTTLLIPAAGRSTRFPNTRPKWLLTMSDGSLMFEKSLSLLNLEKFEEIILICLQEHIEKFINLENLEEIIKKLHKNFKLCILDKITNSQAETIAYALEVNKVNGPFYTKDCDNQFSVEWECGDEISVVNLSEFENLISAKNKSYVTVDHLNNVTNIVEKKVISNFFCCGGFGFSSAAEFIKHFKMINTENEIYVSHIVYSMLISGSNFKAVVANKYADWGTFSDYQNYMNSFHTIFCDVDGVLFNNGSKFGKNGWNTDPIIENLEFLLNLQKKGNLYLVITSSRPEKEIVKINQYMNEIGLFPDKYVMNLPHSKRYLVNDYASSNPYPTAIAINIERNSNQLKSFFNM